MNSFTDIDPKGLPRAIRSDMPGYEQVRHSYSSAGAPAAVLAVEDAGDIPTAIRFAAEERLALSIRSGGHGPSTNDGGVVIDLAQLRGVEVIDAARRRVRVEAGARWAEVARELDRHRLALTSGDYGDVGVGGLATAGGIGLLARRQGLTLDRIRAVEMFLADGSFVRADEHEHADLFWAVRGAGGAFGVVTAFEFEAEQIDQVATGTFVFEPTDLGGLIERWGELVEQAPRDLTSFFYVTPSLESERPLVRAMVVYADADEQAGRRALAPFMELPSVKKQEVAAAPYAALLTSSREPHQAQAAAFAGRAGLLDHISGESAAAMAALLSSKTAAILQLRSVGGAVNDVAGDATAYAHRQQNFALVAVGPRQRQAEFEAAWSAGPGIYLDGTYLNLETERDESALRRAYPPSTLARLQELKRRYDPDRVFDQSLKIPAS